MRKAQMATIRAKTAKIAAAIALLGAGVVVPAHPASAVDRSPAPGPVLARKQLIGRWVTQYPAEFGGTWFDPKNNRWHVQATSEATLSVMTADATKAGIAVTGHQVAYSYRELTALADEVDSGQISGRGLSDGQIKAGLDVVGNRVIVRTTSAALHAQVAADARVRVLTDPATTFVPASCVSRTQCDAPLPGGVVISRPGALCSSAFTGGKADGSRWLITAGHCTAQINETWTHNNRFIGPVRFRQNVWNGEGPTDSGLVRIDNAYWRNAPGGYQYHGGVLPSHLVDLDNYVANMALIEVGDRVCYNARSSDYGGANCGNVDLVRNPDAFGFTTTHGYAVCGGDSGGAALFNISNQRWGYGIISLTNNIECPPNAGNGYYSGFEPLPRAIGQWSGVVPEIR